MLVPIPIPAGLIAFLFFCAVFIGPLVVATLGKRDGFRADAAQFPSHDGDGHER